MEGSQPVSSTRPFWKISVILLCALSVCVKTSVIPKNGHVAFDSDSDQDATTAEPDEEDPFDMLTEEQKCQILAPRKNSKSGWSGSLSNMPLAVGSIAEAAIYPAMNDITINFTNENTTEPLKFSKVLRDFVADAEETCKIIHQQMLEIKEEMAEIPAKVQTLKKTIKDDEMNQDHSEVTSQLNRIKKAFGNCVVKSAESESRLSKILSIAQKIEQSFTPTPEKKKDEIKNLVFDLNVTKQALEIRSNYTLSLQTLQRIAREQIKKCREIYENQQVEATDSPNITIQTPDSPIFPIRPYSAFNFLVANLTVFSALDSWRTGLSYAQKKLQKCLEEEEQQCSMNIAGLESNWKIGKNLLFSNDATPFQKYLIDLNNVSWISEKMESIFPNLKQYERGSLGKQDPEEWKNISAEVASLLEDLDMNMDMGNSWRKYNYGTIVEDLQCLPSDNYGQKMIDQFILLEILGNEQDVLEQQRSKLIANVADIKQSIKKARSTHNMMRETSLNIKTMRINWAQFLPAVQIIQIATKLNQVKFEVYHKVLEKRFVNNTGGLSSNDLKRLKEHALDINMVAFDIYDVTKTYTDVSESVLALFSRLPFIFDMSQGKSNTELVRKLVHDANEIGENVVEGMKEKEDECEEKKDEEEEEGEEEEEDGTNEDEM